MADTIWAVTATYNERDNLETLAEGILALPSAVTLLIVDDGSPDGTGDLADEQIQKIAADALIDPANFAIFINGYALHCKRVS